jgi:predicted DNA-binding protein
LEVILEYDMRDPGVYFYARSGKKISTKTRIDEIAKSIGKKPVNYEAVENRLIDKNDISMALNGSAEEKNKLIQDLEDWYLENS